MAELKWVWHDEEFASLMCGRIWLAKIGKSSTGPWWFYSLRFTVEGERATFSTESKEETMRVCEEHARKVLSE